MKETDTMVLFWDGWPSQWHPSPFFDQNFILYKTAEQYMMAEKARFFNDQIAVEKIMAARSPGEQKKIGRLVGTFEGARPFDPEAWAVESRIVVKRGTLFKFTQNPDLRQAMLDSGDKIIVEASPYDKIWGIGLGEDDPRALDPAQWQGLNWLGEAVMDVRKILRGSNGHG